ncbi:MAG TPA: homoserine dehydrogenase [Terriglobales bacterium]
MVTSPKLIRRDSDAAAQPCRVALIGFGTVGRSVARIITSRTDLRLTHILNRNVERKRVDWVHEDVRWTQNFDDVVNSDVKVILELVGGLDPAEQWVRRALENGKSVVTANKQLIARRGPELLELARENGQHLLYGASVAGGIPVLLGLQEGLGGDRIHRLSGILNGTCNYILSQIENVHISFAEALEQAQAKGFAEANASEDIDGFDARAKLTILARTALNATLEPEQVATRGIREVEQIDFAYAHDLGCTIRQISRAEVKGDTLFAGVQPALVPQTSALARVTGSQNVVVSTGEFGGETVFSGHGAGGDPTAVAVVSDLLWLARNRHNQVASDDVMRLELKISGDFKSAHYVRFKVADKPGILAALANIYSRHEINVDAVLQQAGHSKSALPFVITLEPCRVERLRAALAEIRNLDFHVAPPVDMPILTQG